MTLVRPGRVVSDRSHHHLEQMTLARDPAGLVDASAVLSVKDSILSLTHAASLNPMQPSCLGLLAAGARVCSEVFCASLRLCPSADFRMCMAHESSTCSRPTPRVRVRGRLRCHSNADDKDSRANLSTYASCFCASSLQFLSFFPYPDPSP